jgi:hypothetical protein
MGHLIDGIKEGVGNLRSWMVKYVKRYANSAAHILVREAFSCVIDRVLVEKKFKTVFMIL